MRRPTPRVDSISEFILDLNSRTEGEDTESIELTGDDWSRIVSWAAKRNKVETMPNLAVEYSTALVRIRHLEKSNTAYRIDVDRLRAEIDALRAKLMQAEDAAIELTKLVKTKEEP